MSSYALDRIARNTRAKPLGRRQAAILSFAKQCVSEGGPFPTTEQIAQHFDRLECMFDIDTSLLGLQARGLIEATERVQRRMYTFPSGWRITEAGWSVSND